MSDNASSRQRKDHTELSAVQTRDNRVVRSFCKKWSINFKSLDGAREITIVVGNQKLAELMCW